MKVNKYDRQVRIWGFKGQKKLAEAKVAIIGCAAASIEAAKNLILPGVGTVDIFDDQVVTVHDLATSFFYTHESVGKFKGEEAVKNLLEMNPDVAGQFKHVSISRICDEPERWLGGYNVAVCSNLSQDENKKISNLCWKLNLSAIFITSVGFFFHIRSQKQVHIVESESIASKKYYLRLHDPFEGLNQYVRVKELPLIISQLKQHQQNLELKEKLEKDFNKITYPVFLAESYRILKKSLSRTPKVQQVKALLTEWKQLVSEDSNNRSGVNEALIRSFDLYQSYENFLPSLDIFEDERTLTATDKSEFIYIFLKSVKQFMALNRNHLPQIVRLPDISTSTKEYLQFKNIYKAQHQKHLKQLKNIISSWWPEYILDDKLLAEYLNNIDALKIVKMRKYAEQIEAPKVKQSCLEYTGYFKSLFVALRAYKMFEQQTGKAPVPNDAVKVLQLSKKMSEKWQLTDIDERFVQEICRYEGKSLISYDSVAGAIAGQEAIKLITQCFTPLNNGYLFDGVHCKGLSVTL